jgi:hypothetical protein
MQVLSYSGTFCLLGICGLQLRSQSLISASRSPNFMTSDPSLESNSVSNEMNPVLGLLIFLLAVPAFLAIILQPSTQSALRDAFTALRKSNPFASTIMKPLSATQSESFEEGKGSSKPPNTASNVLRSQDVELAFDQSRNNVQPNDLNPFEIRSFDFCDRSKISARRASLPETIQNSDFK